MPSASAAAPPGPPVRSVTSTWAPAAAALNAAADPAAPNPTTITSAVSSQRVISPASHGVTSFGSRTPSSLRCRRDGSRCRPGGPRRPTLGSVPPLARARRRHRPSSTRSLPAGRRRWPTGSSPTSPPGASPGPDGAVRFAKVARGGEPLPDAARRVRAHGLGRALSAGARGGGAGAARRHHHPAHRGAARARRHPPGLAGDLPALVRALGRGLRAFHEAVGEEWCPFRFDLARALAHVEERVRAGDIRRHRLPRGARPPDPGGRTGGTGGHRPRRRGPGRLPRRLLPAQRAPPGAAG